MSASLLAKIAISVVVAGARRMAHARPTNRAGWLPNQLLDLFLSQ
jgi:hypothetical protein